MASAVIGELAMHEQFVPIMIANMFGPNEEIVGGVQQQLFRQILAIGQVLMVVVGYVGRGVVLKCGRGALAIRRADGVFDEPELRKRSATMEMP